MVDPDLEQALGLSDHVSQTMGGSQILAQVFLIRTTSHVLPLD